MNIIKVLFVEIVSRLLMIVLAVLVLTIGLYSPGRLLYMLHNYTDPTKGCPTC